MRLLPLIIVPLAAATAGVAQLPPGLPPQILELLAKRGGAAPGAHTKKVTPPAAGNQRLRPRVVFGTIVDPDGEPIAGAGVTLGSLDSLITTDCVTRPLARTDADGKFAFTLQPPEKDEAKLRQHLLAYADGWLALRTKMPNVSYAAIREWRQPTTREEKVAVIAFEVLARVWGRVAKTKRDGIDLAKLELRCGITVKGRVVDEKGAPVANARITAQNLLTQSRFRGIPKPGKKIHYDSYAKSAADGCFELPGVHASGSVVSIKAESFFDAQRQVVGVRDDLTLTIRRGGFVVGKVIGQDDKPCEASVQVRYELARTNYTEKVGKEGEFKFNLRFPDRFRLVITPKGKSAKDHTKTYSEILSGAQGNLVVKLDKKKVKPKKKKPDAGSKRTRWTAAKIGFPVSVIDDNTRRPLTNFKAAAIWVAPDRIVNETYYEGRFRRKAKKSKQPGYIRLPGPMKDGLEKGALVIQAKGYAAYVKSGLDWGNSRVGHIIARLVPESILGGVVRDDVTGEPIPATRVRLYKYTADRRSSRSAHKQSGKDGRFEFRGLRAGHYRIHVSHKGRPSNNVSIDLGSEEKRADLIVNLRHAATVRGRIVGVKPGKGWQAELLSESHVRSMMYNPSYRPSGKKVDLKPDGTFEFKEVVAGFWEVCVRIPRGNGKGGPMQIPLEPIRVRSRDMDLVVDASEDRPGRLRGKIALTGTKVDFARLMVISTPHAAQPNYYYYRYNSNVDLSGARSTVDADGSFDLRVRKGRQRIKVLDVLTGVLLFQSPPIEVDSDKTVTETVKLALAKVRVRIEAREENGRVGAAWLNIEVEQPRPAALQMFGFFGMSSGRRPTGVSLLEHQGDIELILPLYKTRFQVVTDVARLARTKSKPNNQVGDAEIVPVLGKVNEVKIEVDIPETGFDPDPEETDDTKKEKKRKAKKPAVKKPGKKPPAKREAKR